jgi:hypothetical protein
VHIDHFDHVAPVHGEVLLGHRLHDWVTILPNGPGMHAFQRLDALTADP